MANVDAAKHRALAILNSVRFAGPALALGCGLLLAAAPAPAQRGGGHVSGGGARGGFGFSGPRGGAGFGAARPAFGNGAERPAASVRGPYAGGYRPGFGPGSRYPGAPATAFRSRVGGYPARGYASAARPSFYTRTPARYRGGYPGGNRYSYRGRGSRFRYGYAYPATFGTSLVFDPFLFDPLWDYGDPFWSSDDGYGSLAAQSFADPGAYVQPQQGPVADTNQFTSGQKSSEAYEPSPETEPGPWAPQRYPQAETPKLPRQEALVTIVYKDGRAPEHIRNYALTRSALLLTGPQMREIPLDEVDLAATERVNRAAGVDFRLPQSY
jgi:hypothetical protein